MVTSRSTVSDGSNPKKEPTDIWTLFLDKVAFPLFLVSFISLITWIWHVERRLLQFETTNFSQSDGAEMNKDILQIRDFMSRLPRPEFLDKRLDRIERKLDLEKPPNSIHVDK